MKKLITFFTAILLIVSFQALHAQKKYSGSKHSSSHSGSYKGGKGSSHKGGMYKIQTPGTGTESTDKNTNPI